MYAPGTVYTVYDNDVWWWDSWDAMDYGIEYNFEKSFFQQYGELNVKVPKFATMNVQCEDSNYANIALQSRNCYLVFWCVRNESCLYGHIVWDSEDCLDCLYCSRCQHVAHSIDCLDCYNVVYAQDCNNCSDSSYLYYCEWCKDCFGCVGLKNKQYCIFNEQYSKADYQKKLLELQLLNSQEVQARFEEVKLKNNIVPYIAGFQIEGCSGDYIYESKNCIYCFDTKSSEDSKYLFTSFKQLNSYDISFTWAPSQLCYEALTIAQSHNTRFSQMVFDCSEVFYSECCYNSSYLFGCVGLRDAQYCIFNRQYSQQEYEKLVPKIIEKMKEDWEWWEFFPSSMSPFWYNETTAQAYFPLEKSEAEAARFRWSKYEAPFPKAEKVIPASKLPENISDIPDDILNWAIVCEVTWKPFRIVSHELKFYRKHNLPVPKKHPDQRHADRMSMKNPRKLLERNCDSCGIDINTTCTPESQKLVYCDTCYDAHAY